MKICQDESCNNEIETWQTYCQKHYAQKMAQQETQDPTGQPSTQIPEQPEQPEMIKEQEKKILPPEPIVKEPLPEIDSRTASIVSQTAFKGAIELMARMEFEGKNFEALIGEIRTLTNEFYRIIVEKRK